LRQLVLSKLQTESDSYCPSEERYANSSDSGGFNVSVDYIIGEGELAALDKDLLKRIEDIEKLDEATKQHLFFLIDNVIQNYKTKKAFNK